nr:hypothetical protein [Flavobacterium sp. ASV13]
MKYLKKYFKIVLIDILVYQISRPVFFENVISFTIEEEKISNNKIRYYIKENDKIIHNSYVFKSLHILKLIDKKGPAIGDCFTIDQYRGQSIYPFVINKIANEIIANGKPEVFILVNSNNKNSIRGIEKAGYSLHSKIVAKRFLFFYFNKKIIKFNS